MFDVWIHNNCLLSDVEKEYRAKDFLQSIFDELFELVENLTDNIHVTISGEPRYLKIKDEVHVHQLDKKQGWPWCEIEPIKYIKNYYKDKPNTKILYFNNFGVVQGDGDLHTIRKIISSTLVSNHKKCLELLNDSDMVGMNMHGEFGNFQANMWYCNSEHIKKVPIPNHVEELQTLDYSPESLTAFPAEKVIYDLIGYVDHDIGQWWEKTDKNFHVEVKERKHEGHWPGGW
jgi:hypothetical protein